MIILSVDKNGQPHSVHKLEQNRIILGRQTDCDVPLEDMAVSRQHAIIECRGEKYTIADAFSKNGTVVNNRCISSTRLQSGDEIVIQPFRIQVEMS
jgi:pSer/pThr/pTyr-binding forkhead associated (FHA) protein